MPATSPLKLGNTILCVLITGCRWCDRPHGLQWASKSAVHRWWQCWQANSTPAALPTRIFGIADEQGMIQWLYGAVNGSFSPGTGGGEGMAYGCSCIGTVVIPSGVSTSA